MVLGVELRASSMLAKFSTRELHPHPEVKIYHTHWSKQHLNK